MGIFPSYPHREWKAFTEHFYWEVEAAHAFLWTWEHCLSIPSQLFPQVKTDSHADLKGCKERCEDSEWCFKWRLCSAQQALNRGERSPIMRLDWPSLIRITSAQYFTTASDPLNAKCFPQPVLRGSHCAQAFATVLHSKLFKTALFSLLLFGEGCK